MSRVFRVDKSVNIKGRCFDHGLFCGGCISIGSDWTTLTTTHPLKQTTTFIWQRCLLEGIKDSQIRVTRGATAFLCSRLYRLLLG